MLCCVVLACPVEEGSNQVALLADGMRSRGHDWHRLEYICGHDVESSQHTVEDPHGTAIIFHCLLCPHFVFPCYSFLCTAKLDSFLFCHLSPPFSATSSDAF